MNDDYAISIGKDEVEVRLQPSTRSPHAKLGGVIFVASIIVGVSGASLFLPGKHGSSSMWRGMMSAGSESGASWVLLGFLIVIAGFLAWLGFRWSEAAWPSDESFHCDMVALTISRVPYLDFANRRWRIRSYPLRDVQRFRYAVYAAIRGDAIYGFRFNENGNEHKILPGLEAPEAETILKALGSLGVAVVLDDKLQKKTAEALEKRGNQISPSL